MEGEGERRGLAGTMVGGSLTGRTLDDVVDAQNLLGRFSC